MQTLQVEDTVSIILRHEHGYKPIGRIGKMGSAEELLFATNKGLNFKKTQFISVKEPLLTSVNETFDCLET